MEHLKTAAIRVSNVNLCECMPYSQPVCLCVCVRDVTLSCNNVNERQED